MKSKNQNGGQRVVPLYNEEKNSPFIPNQQKKLYNERLAEKYPSQSVQTTQPAQSTQSTQPSQFSRLNPIVNLQVYQPPKPREPKMPQISTFNPLVVQTPFYPPQYNYQLPPYMMNQPVIQPIMNSYNISIDGITGEPGKVNLIYEDILPTKQFISASSTIGERLNIYNFVRAMMFPQGDGQNIGLDGKSTDTILSHLKFMDLNPYNTYKFSNNPYKGLATGFLIYRSCYPIRYDAIESAVICAKDSVGANIRVYRMTEGSYKLQKNIVEYNEWREVSYYEYVREHIIKTRECPNFVILYGYYISLKSNIDFDKIAMLRGVQIPNEPTYLHIPPFIKTIKEPKSSLINVECNPCQPHLIAQVGGVKLLDKIPDNPISYNLSQKNDTKQGGNLNITNPNAIIINPNAYLGKALVVMTEAPNYNIFGWASKTYQMDGNIRRQINTGFHDDKIWFNIIFQIMVALYCMQINKIYFNDFTVEDNIYIKDINTYGAVTKYWKYIIDGFQYYIPNYGYIVMIDSNYKDLPNQNIICPQPKTEYKIYSKFLNPDIDNQQFKDKTFDQFKYAIDPDIYGQAFVNTGGCKPPPDVIRLLSEIKNEASTDKDKDIGKYLYKFMRRFLNNRIGTFLRETEIANIRKDEQKDFTKGQLVVYEDGSSSYKFVALIDLKTSNIGIANILTRNAPTDEDIIEKSVPITSLYGYTKMEPIIQNFKPNESNLNEDDLLETYIMMSN